MRWRGVSSSVRVTRLRHKSKQSSTRLLAKPHSRAITMPSTTTYVTAALAVTGASALVPAARPSRATTVRGAASMDRSTFAGGLPGNEIPGVPASRFDFDPLGFAARASPAELVKYREAELKHGRVAMLAVTGMLFAEVWHPMLGATENVPAIFAFQATLQQSVILAPVLAGIAAVETVSFPGWEPTDFKMKEGVVPGSYANIEGASPWTKDKLSADEYRRKEVVELNNGRLAMLACVGIWAQELINGQPVMLTFLERVAQMDPAAIKLLQ